jgi:hypothetical protein
MDNLWEVTGVIGFQFRMIIQMKSIFGMILLLARFQLKSKLATIHTQYMLKLEIKPMM